MQFRSLQCLLTHCNDSIKELIKNYIFLFHYISSYLIIIHYLKAYHFIFLNSKFNYTNVLMSLLRIEPMPCLLHKMLPLGQLVTVLSSII